MTAVQQRRRYVRAKATAWRFRLPFLLSFLFWAWAWFSFAAPPQGSHVVVLIERGATFYLKAARGFKQAFRPSAEEGVSYVSGDPRELHAVVEDLRKDPPRLVVAFGTQTAIAAKSRLPHVPILYCLALNPVENDLVGRAVGGVRLEVDFAQQFADLEKLWLVDGRELEKLQKLVDEVKAHQRKRSSNRYKVKNPDGSVARQPDRSRVRTSGPPPRQVRVVGIPRNPILKLAFYIREHGVPEASRPKRRAAPSASAVHRKQSSSHRSQSKSR